MTALFSRAVVRYGRWIPVAWLLVWVLTEIAVRTWSPAETTSLLIELPSSAPSQRAEQLFDDAFSQDLMDSSLFILISRAGRNNPLKPADSEFIRDVLQPALKLSVGKVLQAGRPEGTRRVPYDIDGPDNPLIGQLLRSADRQAELIVVSLGRTVDRETSAKVLASVERLVAQRGPYAQQTGNLPAAGKVPPGLAIELVGVAVVQRDLQIRQQLSRNSVRIWAFLLTFVVMLLACRTPVAVVTSLACIALAGRIVHNALQVLTDPNLPAGTSETSAFLTVTICSIGGVNALWLISQYCDAWLRHRSGPEATLDAVSRMMPLALRASVVLIAVAGCMSLATMSTLRSLSILIGAAAGVVTLVQLTLLPALLRLFGRISVWPHVVLLDSASASNWSLAPAGFSQSQRGVFAPKLWTAIALGNVRYANMLFRGGLLSSCLLIAWAAWSLQTTTWGLSMELPIDSPSVRGTVNLQRHFPAGITAPVSILMESPQQDFRSARTRSDIAELVDRLAGNSSPEVADIRFVDRPLGVGMPHWQAENVFVRMVYHRKIVKHFVADRPPHENHVTKIDVILAQDPLSPQGVAEFVQLQQSLAQHLPSSLAQANIQYRGASAEIADLQQIVRRDLWKTMIATTLATMVVLALVAPTVRSGLAVAGLTIIATWASLGLVTSLRDLFAGGLQYTVDWKLHILSITVLMATGPLYCLDLLALQLQPSRVGRATLLISSLIATNGLSLAIFLLTAGVSLSFAIAELQSFRELGATIVVGSAAQWILLRQILLPAWLARQTPAEPATRIAKKQ